MRVDVQVLSSVPRSASSGTSTSVSAVRPFLSQSKMSIGFKEYVMVVFGHAISKEFQLTRNTVAIRS